MQRGESRFKEESVPFSLIFDLLGQIFVFLPIVPYHSLCFLTEWYRSPLIGKNAMGKSWLTARLVKDSAAGAPQVQHDTAGDDEQNAEYAGGGEAFLENVRGNQGGDDDADTAPQGIGYAQVDLCDCFGHAEIAGDVQDAAGRRGRQLGEAF